jgi:hypothetical protein
MMFTPISDKARTSLADFLALPETMMPTELFDGKNHHDT